MKISKHFTREEIACKCGCGFDTIDIITLQLADEVREFCGHSITPSSGCRCASYNARVGGADNSQHVQARAIDLPVKNPKELFDYLCEKYPGKYGFGLYPTFVHIDSRTNGGARWHGK